MKPKKWQQQTINGNYAIQRTFPDSTDVIISIKRTNESYEVWSNSESRSSGPHLHLEGTTKYLNEAINQVNNEAYSWDEELDQSF